MPLFTENFLNARRGELLRNVCRFQYQLDNGTWQNGTINRKEIKRSDVVVFVNVPSSGRAYTITGVRVYDNNNELAGEQEIKLQRSSLNTALLRFTFPMIEET
ncbi:MAG: MBF2 family protein [Oscillospiraceae bacterium]|nr:MBF2 family protein [Oscillospiraceae bacterium]